MQDIAAKKLIEDPNMTAVVMTVTDARVVLTGTVSTAATKAKDGPQTVIEQIVAAIDQVRAKATDRPVLGLGVGAPGPLDPVAGVSIGPPTLTGWHAP